MTANVEIGGKVATISRNMTKKYSEFVRLTDVKEIIVDIVQPLLQANKTREDEALTLKT